MCDLSLASCFLIHFLFIIGSLSNLFNATPRKSCLRLFVYRALLQIATANDELEVLQLSRAGVEIWLSEWNISAEEKSKFLKSIIDAYVKSGQL